MDVVIDDRRIKEAEMNRQPKYIIREGKIPESMAKAGVVGIIRAVSLDLYQNIAEALIYKNGAVSFTVSANVEANPFHAMKLNGNFAPLFLAKIAQIAGKAAG
jgi:hypothetical protein